MDRQTRKLTSRDFLSAITAAAILVFAFPRFDVEVLAFVALVPLLAALEGLNARQGAWLGYVFGLHWNVFLLYWLSPATTPGFIAAVIYLSFYSALFGFLYVAFSIAYYLPGLPGIMQFLLSLND